MTCLIDIREVEKRTGFKRSSIYKRRAQGDFPQPVKTGARATRWFADEIDVWVESLRLRRDSISTGSENP